MQDKCDYKLTGADIDEGFSVEWDEFECMGDCPTDIINPRISHLELLDGATVPVDFDAGRKLFDQLPESKQAEIVEIAIREFEKFLDADEPDYEAIAEERADNYFEYALGLSRFAGAR